MGLIILKQIIRKLANGLQRTPSRPKGSRKDAVKQELFEAAPDNHLWVQAYPSTIFHVFCFKVMEGTQFYQFLPIKILEMHEGYPILPIFNGFATPGGEWRGKVSSPLSSKGWETIKN